MTHAGISPEEKIEFGITANLIRLSVGVEHVEDLWWDLNAALNTIDTKEVNSIEHHSSARTTALVVM